MVFNGKTQYIIIMNSKIISKPNEPRSIFYFCFVNQFLTYLLFLLHLSLQYLTCSQFFSHFFLQLNGFSQTAQYFTGKCCFFNYFVLIILLIIPLKTNQWSGVTKYQYNLPATPLGLNVAV